MKRTLLYVILFSPVIAFGQWEDDNNPQTIFISEANSVLYINDIDSFCKINNLIYPAWDNPTVFLIRGEQQLGKFLIAPYETVLLCQKQDGLYKATFLINSYAPEIENENYSFLNKNLVLINDYETYFSLINQPVIGHYTYMAQYLYLFDTSNSQTLISLKLSENRRETFVDPDTSITLIDENTYLYDNDTFSIAPNIEWFSFDYYCDADKIYLYQTEK